MRKLLTFSKRCIAISAVCLCTLSVSACGQSEDIGNKITALQEENDDLKADISELKKENEELKEKLKELTGAETDVGTTSADTAVAETVDESYKAAYSEFIKNYTNRYEGLESEYAKMEYGLIYFDDDDIPELSAGLSGYYVDLYTYRNGTVVPILEDWGYGLGGNAGYGYLPRKGIINNTDQDYAGLLYYITYWQWDSEKNELKELDDRSGYFTYIVDVDGDGIYSDAEQDKADFDNPHFFIGDREVSESEFNSKGFDGEFDYIAGEKSYDEILALLRTDTTSNASSTAGSKAEVNWKDLYIAEVQDIKSASIDIVKKYNIGYSPYFNADKNLWFDLIDVDNDGIPELLSFESCGDFAWISSIYNGQVKRELLHNTWANKSGFYDYGAYSAAFEGINRVIRSEYDCNYEKDGDWTSPGAEIIDPEHPYIWDSYDYIYKLNDKKELELIGTFTYEYKMSVDYVETFLDAKYNGQSVSQDEYDRLWDSLVPEYSNFSDFGSGQAAGKGINADNMIKRLNGGELLFEVNYINNGEAGLSLKVEDYQDGQYLLNIDLNKLPGDPKEGSIYGYRNEEWYQK